MSVFSKIKNKTKSKTNKQTKKTRKNKLTEKNPQQYKKNHPIITWQQEWIFVRYSWRFQKGEVMLYSLILDKDTSNFYFQLLKNILQGI